MIVLQRLLCIIALFLYGSLAQGAANTPGRQGKLFVPEKTATISVEHKDPVDRNKNQTVKTESRGKPENLSAPDAVKAKSSMAIPTRSEIVTNRSESKVKDPAVETTSKTSQPVKNSESTRSLDLREGFGETKSSAQPQPIKKSYSIIDLKKIEADHPVQRLEKGKEIRFNERMTDPIDIYVQALEKAPQYRSLAKQIPEIFASYVLEFFQKQSGNTGFFGGLKSFFTASPVYSPEQLVRRSYDWINLTDFNADLPNLYMGMKTLNGLFESNVKIYDRAAESGNRFMDVDMNVYVEALRPQFPHVPNKILELYVTTFLNDPANQKYEQKKEANFLGIKRNVNDLTKPIAMTPEYIASKTQGELVRDKLSGLEMPIKDNVLDVVELKNFQKIYLTMRAIENINSRYLSEYRSKGVEGGVELQPQKSLENKITAAIASPGSVESFFLRCGIPKEKMTTFTTEQINRSRDALQENYPSFERLKDLTLKDPVAFDQLQIDYVNINQDIIAIKNRYGFSSDQVLTTIQSPKNIRDNVQNLVVQAQNLSRNMNQLIVDRKVADFFENSLPSAEKDFSLDNTFTVTKELFKDNASLPEYLKQQQNQIRSSISSVLSGIQDKISNLHESALVETTLPDLIEKAEVELKSAENNALISDQSKLTFQITKGFVEQLKLNLKQLETSRKQLEQQAERIIREELPDSSSSQDRGAVVVKMLEKLKQSLSDRKISSDRKIASEVEKLVELYKNEEFEYQDIPKLNQKIRELLEKNKDNQALKLYNQVFSQLDRILEPYQASIQREHKVNAQTKLYVDNILDSNVSINDAIKTIEKKLTELNTNKDVNLTSAQNDLNKILDNKDRALPDGISKFSIKAKDNLGDIYNKILTELKERKRVQNEASSAFQLGNNLYGIFHNLYELEGRQAGSHALGAGWNTPGAAVEVAGVLTTYVDTTLGKVKDKLDPKTLFAIAAVITAVSTALIQIQQSNGSADEKRKMQNDVLGAMMADIGNLVIADQTGATVDVVASGDAQAIATSGFFNKAINMLNPEAQTSFSYDSSVTTPGYVSNVSRFQNKNAAILQNQSYPQSSSNNAVSGYNRAPVVYNPYDSYEYPY
ncbi:hypothetical protein KBC04_02755 [Candidatus Babeliales bacterium]|nr:hypothetical protein [Candidatus Babeliales bacterium]MBP9844027.1 hypothetical protein [Candidatus Babeliales bacterium]